MAESEQPTKVVIVSEHEIDGPPLDFSFKNIRDLAEIIRKEARSGQRLPIPPEEEIIEEKKETNVTNLSTAQRQNKAESEDLEDEVASKPKPEERIKSNNAPLISKLIAENTTSINASKPSGGRLNDNKRSVVKKKRVKRLTTSLNIGYNQIRSLDGFLDVVSRVMEYARRLVWIDLSNNYLTTLTADFAELSDLRSLYLNANYIYDLKEITKLSNTQIKTLTLYGNPIEQVPSYRLWIVGIMPTLRKLDTGLITLLERDNANVMYTRTKRKSLPKLADPRQPPPLEEPKADQEEAQS